MGFLIGIALVYNYIIFIFSFVSLYFLWSVPSPRTRPWWGAGVLCGFGYCEMGRCACCVIFLQLYMACVRDLMVLRVTFRKVLLNECHVSRDQKSQCDPPFLRACKLF